MKKIQQRQLSMEHQRFRQTRDRSRTSVLPLKWKRKKYCMRALHTKLKAIYGADARKKSCHF